MRRKAIRLSYMDGFEVRDVSFEYGPWVPLEDVTEVRSAYMHACGYNIRLPIRTACAID